MDQNHFILSDELLLIQTIGNGIKQSGNDEVTPDDKLDEALSDNLPKIIKK